jgi:mRNA guanylyltransferase
MDSLERPGTQVTDHAELRNLKTRVQTLISRSQNSLTERTEIHRFPGSQPVSLAREHLSLLQSEPFLVCEKSDGVRYLLLIPGAASAAGVVESYAFLIDRRYCFWRVRVTVPGKLLSRGDSIFDGELVLDYGTETRFLIFDTLLSGGVAYIHNSFLERLQVAFIELIYPIRQQGSSSKTAIELFLKDFYPTSEVDFLFNAVINKGLLPHGNDGLIFTEVKAPYVLKTTTHILKWKPPEVNTIDFIVKAEQFGSAWKFLLNTFNGYQLEVFDEIEFVDEEEQAQVLKLLAEIPVLVLECVMLEGRWKVLKMRTDKDTANATPVANRIKKSIMDNLTADELVARLTGGEPEPRKMMKTDTE